LFNLPEEKAADVTADLEALEETHDEVCDDLRQTQQDNSRLQAEQVEDLGVRQKLAAAAARVKVLTQRLARRPTSQQAATGIVVDLSAFFNDADKRNKMLSIYCSDWCWSAVVASRVVPTFEQFLQELSPMNE
jgi:asparagine synthetase A